MKKTKTRSLVLNLLKASKEPLNAREIFDKLANDNVTLSSIYRTLETFTKEDLVIKANDSMGIAIYSLHQKEHSHYLECKNCHEKIELDFCPYHKINAQISKSHNFEVDEQNLVIYGLCRKCKK